MNALDRNIKVRQELTLKREMMLKRQQHIVESVDKEDKTSTEWQLRSSLLVHKFWNFIVKRTLEKEKKKNKGVEGELNRIKKELACMESVEKRSEN